jgi:hypothetical protein
VVPRSDNVKLTVPCGIVAPETSGENPDSRSDIQTETLPKVPLVDGAVGPADGPPGNATRDEMRLSLTHTAVVAGTQNERPFNRLVGWSCMDAICSYRRLSSNQTTQSAPGLRKPD